MTEESVKEKVSRFFDAFSVPQCLGAIDGTHIEIKQPLLNSSDYINRKLRFTLNCVIIVVALWTLLSSGQGVYMMPECLQIHG